MMKCNDCGEQMKPLLYSYYCPNDCDRKVADDYTLAKRSAIDGYTWDGVPIEIDADDSNVTPPYGTPMFGPRLSIPCPKCGSIDTDSFTFGSRHCWPCGHVW